jgi:succinate-semialdehyde dehydrogenase/glutarate-semialdehyde dehydrogenase
VHENVHDEFVTRLAHAMGALRGYFYAPTALTRDLARGLTLSERLEVGMVGLNRGIVSDPAAPFGGVKRSGPGREGRHEGMMEFLETQYISVSW